MSHTPGPWRFQQDGGEPYWSVDMPRPDGEEYGSANAMVYTNEADARLIAAAPDLLAALIRMRDEFNSYVDCPSKCDAVSMAFQAVEKAGGE